MKIVSKKFAALTAVAALGAGSLIFAAETRGPRHHHRGGALMQVLTDSQKAQAKGVFEQARETGKPVRQERLPGGDGDYYSSPVGGDGKVYLIGQQGRLAVVSAEGNWQVLARARFEEEVYATPALVDGRIYLRTTGHLYCFGVRP